MSNAVDNKYDYMLTLWAKSLWSHDLKTSNVWLISALTEIKSVFKSRKLIRIDRYVSSLIRIDRYVRSLIRIYRYVRSLIRFDWYVRSFMRIDQYVRSFSYLNA